MCLVPREQTMLWIVCLLHHLKYCFQTLDDKFLYVPSSPIRTATTCHASIVVASISALICFYLPVCFVRMIWPHSARQYHSTKGTPRLILLIVGCCQISHGYFNGFRSMHVCKSIIITLPVLSVFHCWSDYYSVREGIILVTLIC